MNKLIICGGRDYNLSDDDLKFLDGIHEDFPVIEVVSGGCAGADKGGERWARANGIAVKQFLPDWVAEGKKAGPLRNQEMAEYADGCIAFPGGNGTQDMLKRAREAGLHVWDLTYNESTQAKEE